MSISSARASLWRQGRQKVADARMISYTLAFGAGLVASGSILYTISRRRQFSATFAPLRNDSWPGFQGSGNDVNVRDRPKQGAADKDNNGKSNFLPDWTAMGDRIRSAVVPEWAQAIPMFVDKLQGELAMKPGTLADDIWQSAHDAETHPEIERPAQVRVSNELCEEEREYLKRRKRVTAKALAKYLGLKEDEVHPDDVPTIAMCGSGGGLRALVAGSSSYLSAQEDGLFDCVTYTAGVSGSCWLQALYFSSITGQRHDGIIQHLKDRIHTHIAFPPPLLKLVTSAPTNKFLLSGGFEKYYGYKDADFGLVDVYGLLLGARLLVPKGDLDVDPLNLKLSNQKRFLTDAQHPLPIYTAVRHELPLSKDNSDTQDSKEKAKQEAWFQWFETTPYEVFCEEFGLGIPTWSLGRLFDGGKSVPQHGQEGLPETRIPLLMGIWGSAFCATLSHYYREIRPVVKGLTGFGGLDEMITERDDDLVKLHPIEPTSMPNFAYGMKDLLPKTTPASIHTSPDLQLMDAGMSNNLPIYPLLRPGRDVDIVVAFDASADVKQDNWLRVVDGYARQRGIRSWPVGTGWPTTDDAGPEQIGKAMDEADATEAEAADHKLSQAADSKQQDASTSSPSSPKQESNDLSFCNIWVGTTEERTSHREPPPSKQPTSNPSAQAEDWQLLHPSAGICVIYYPFLANPAVPGVDPQTSEFMSTWNFVYTPEDVDKVVQLARANYDEGRERTRSAVRAVWERKRKQRLEREEGDQAKSKTQWWKSEEDSSSS